MPSKKQFFQRWIVHTFAVLVAAQIVPGIGYENPLALILAALLLGILNTVLRPILLLLSLPLLIFTLGLFTLVINAVLLYLVGWLLASFTVATFGAAFWGALVISIISLASNLLLGTKQSHLHVQTRVTRSRPRRPDDPGGPGPVIDV